MQRRGRLLYVGINTVVTQNTKCLEAGLAADCQVLTREQWTAGKATGSGYYQDGPQSVLGPRTRVLHPAEIWDGAEDEVARHSVEDWLLLPGAGDRPSPCWLPSLATSHPLTCTTGLGTFY